MLLRSWSYNNYFGNKGDQLIIYVIDTGRRNYNSNVYNDNGTKHMRCYIHI